MFTRSKLAIETLEEGVRYVLLKLTIETPERRQWCRSGVFIVNFEHISRFSSVSFVKFERVNVSLKVGNLDFSDNYYYKKAYNFLTLFSANFTKWSNTFTQFVGNFPTNCLSVFDHFVGLAFKGLKNLCRTTLVLIPIRGCDNSNFLRLWIIPAYLFVQSQQCKHQNNVRNLLKVNNKDTKTTS